MIYNGQKEMSVVFARDHEGKMIYFDMSDDHQKMMETFQKLCKREDVGERWIMTMERFNEYIRIEK